MINAELQCFAMIWYPMCRWPSICRYRPNKYADVGSGI